MIDAYAKPKKKRRLNQLDRITLSESAKKKCEAWLKQANEHFNGMVQLKGADLVCIILEEMPDTLASQTLEKIKNEKLTDIQKAKWIYQKLKEAKVSGEEVDLESLIKTAQKGSQRKPRAKKVKVISDKTHSENII